ncbi:MAG: hypothetical protein F4X48_03170 [Acidimicrobiia bacterium]|nr:hypothetical protein [Acidimicrobiia bacterium]MYC57578.1 hypothetical protein [Acidimicrobiia bacterium]
MSVSIAIIVGILVIRIGTGILLMIRQPLPPPPPPGELRKVKITYRCSVCYAEVRITMAPEEDPKPPSHCENEMDLIAPVDHD